MAAPQYGTARTVLWVTVGLGILAILAAAGVVAWKLTIGGGFTLYPIAVLLAVNGFAIIASAQMGFAMLDTAISTRDTADALRDFLRRQKQPGTGENAAPRTAYLRAER